MNAQAQDTVETPVSAALLTALRNHAQAVIASGKLKGKQGQRWALKALGVTDDIGLRRSPAQEQAADSIFDTEYDRWEANSSVDACQPLPFIAFIASKF